VRNKRVAAVLLALVAVVLASLVAGSAGTAANKATFQVSFNTDTAGLNDKSFNHLGNLGRLQAQKQLGLQTKVYVSASESDYLPNAVAATQWGAKAVVMNGFLLADATNTAAKQFPDVKWAITDFPRVALADKPANAYGLTFKSEQSGFLVGYLAAEMIKKQMGPSGKLKSKKIVLSAVGGKKIPSVDNWIAGYRAGARAYDKSAKVLIDYSGDFTPATASKCKEIALKHISQGAQAVFQVAGGCGLGALQAAKSSKVWGIGVHPDHS
jgi:basic membrane protein A